MNELHTYNYFCWFKLKLTHFFIQWTPFQHNFRIDILSNKLNDTLGRMPEDLVNGKSIFGSINSLRPRQNGRHFADDTFKRIFLNENARISIKISLKFFPKGSINNIPALVQIMAWRRPGDKPLSEPMMTILPTHICVTRPQWVNGLVPSGDHVDHDLLSPMVSLGHNEFTCCLRLYVYIPFMWVAFYYNFLSIFKTENCT